MRRRPSARGLAALLPGAAPFVELPVGATEDRVVGSLDLAAALTGEAVRFRPGLLAAAHGGVLYVDEVNLLPDHLVDALLDAASSGVNRVEREGIATSHPARFILIGSMNPEEGELRPQFLDRFGLAVSVEAPADPAMRALAVRRRLDFDADPDGAGETSGADEEALAAGLERAAAARDPAGRADRAGGPAVRGGRDGGAPGRSGDLPGGRGAGPVGGPRRRHRGRRPPGGADGPGPPGPAQPVR